MISLQDDLRPVWSHLGEDERRVVLLIAQRLLKGQETYALLNVATEKRDMRQEAAEELLDATAYLAVKALQR